jgi:hypothetical protein
MKILTGCTFELKNLIKLDAHLKASLPEKDQELIIEQLDAKISEKRHEIEMIQRKSHASEYKIGSILMGKNLTAA